MDSGTRTQPKASLGRTIKAVLWSFLGIRRRSGFDEDVAQIRPLHVVAVGLVAAFVLVLGLIGLVNLVVAK